MISVKGIGIGKGMAKGRIYRMQNKDTADVYQKETPPKEKEKLRKAKEQSAEELRALYRKTLSISKESADIFDIHLMMLDDEDFCDYIDRKIEEGKSAPEAVELAGNYFAEVFSEMGDDYMSHRAADILDLSGRLCRNLKGVKKVFPAFDSDTILAADDLSPAETAELDRTHVVGFVTKKGGKNSHTAILAETFGIPALVCAPSNEIKDGDEAILDSRKNTLYIDPTEDVVRQYHSFLEAESQKHARAFVNQEAITSYGKRIRLYCNINSPKEADEAVKAGADGIGLFRSEFLYLGREKLPSEEEQFSAYRFVLEQMEGRPVIVRLADIGSDKPLPCLKLPEEENPALGLRGIRVGLSHPEIFKVQMKALLRSSMYGPLSIMLPMVTTADEVRKVKALWEEAKRALAEDSIPYSEQIGFGVMIETPSAALISDQLARECDFFSIGTNDLWQYTMALDRRGGYQLEDCDAMLRLVRFAVENAHRRGIWAGVCGMAASDSQMARKFIELGADELSVPPRKVSEIKEIILSC